MKRDEMKNRIAASFEEATPDVLGRIRECCKDVEQEKELPVFLSSNTTKNKTLQWQKAVAMAASLLLICLAGFRFGQATSQVATHTPQNISQPSTESTPEIIQEETEKVEPVYQEPVVVATVYLDVNPSIEMTVDEALAVISCQAANEDAVPIIDGMKLEGVDAAVAVNSIVGSLYLHGYLQEDTQGMLVSIDAQNEDIYNQLNQEINESLMTSQEVFESYVQEVDATAVEEKAQVNEVSVGKMEFIEQIINDSTEFTEENETELASYSIRQLIDIFRGLEAAMRERLEQETGTNTEGSAENESIALDQDMNSNGSAGFSDSGNPTSTESNSPIVDQTVDAAENLVDDTLNTTGNLVEDVGNLTKETVNQTAETTNNIVDDVTDGITGLLTDLGNFFHFN